MLQSYLWVRWLLGVDSCAWITWPNGIPHGILPACMPACSFFLACRKERPADRPCVDRDLARFAKRTDLTVPIR